MELNMVYFYTVAIRNWIPLLYPDKFKTIILDSLTHLVKKEKIKVYGFVIMPNHIHIIWENIAMNGKEMPYVSFMKFTAHEFLNKFKIDGIDRNYLFWQKDALPIFIYDRRILEQKLDYIHLNPLQAHWNLVTDPNDYYFSSCSFYEQEDKKFGWLTHYMDMF